MEVMNNPPVIFNLPLETLHAIIYQVDSPVDLISLSQTNRLFRHLINPTKTDFVERLLVLECTKTHGGGTTLWASRDIYHGPAVGTPEWEALRWACTHCLRLLSHVHFNNHALFGIGYRKPFPGILSADIISSWGVFKHGTKWGREAWRSMVPEERRFLHLLRGASVRQIYDLVSPASDAQVSKIEEYLNHVPNIQLEHLDFGRWGLRRRLRKCNECLYSTNLIHPQNIERGLVTFTSRYLHFRSPLERYFPGYSNGLLPGEPQIRLPKFPPSYLNRIGYTTYMLRCPHCCKWQEKRNFAWVLEASQTQLYPFRESNEQLQLERSGTSDDVFGPGICNACLLNKKGILEAGEIFLRWFRKVKNFYMAIIEEQMTYGWRSLEQHRRIARADYSTLSEAEDRYHYILSRIFFDKCGNRVEGFLTEMSSFVDLGLNHQNLHSVQGANQAEERSQLTVEQVAQLRICAWETNSIIRVNNLCEWLEKMDVTLLLWIQDYELIEQHWHWMNRCGQDVELNPKMLVDWAVTQDPLSLS